MKTILTRAAVLIFVIYLAKAASLEPLSHEDGSLELNFTAVRNLLTQLDILILRFRSMEDARNVVVAYLLRQTDCPVQLSIGAGNHRGAHTFTSRERHFAFVATKADLNSTLLANAGDRRGVSLCILMEELTDRELLPTVRHLWHSLGIYGLYFVTPSRGIYFDPFLKSDDRFGALIDMSLAPTFRSPFQTFNGYKLRVYIFDSVYSAVYGEATTKTINTISGADTNVAKLLSKKLNFTMDLQWPDDQFFGTRSENGTFNGALGRLIRYDTDITLTGFFVKDYRTRDIEFSVSVYMDDLCCYVRKAKRIPQSILPLFAVNLDVWSGFLAVGALSPFIWLGIRFLNLHLLPFSNEAQATKSGLFVQYLHIFTDTWVVWVRVNIGRFPPFSSERVFVISMCLVSVIFGALFESSLATVYIRPLYYRDINTMKELDEANFRIYIKHGAMRDDLFYGHSSPVYQNLNRKLILVAELEERLISMMSKRGGFAAVTRASSLVLDDIYYFITKKIHEIPECPKSYHIAYVFPKYSVYQPSIDVMLLRFMEAGLINQWIELMKHKSRTSSHKFPEYVAELGDKWKVLGLSDLQLSFYALALGCTAASLTFIGEVVICFLGTQFKPKINY